MKQLRQFLDELIRQMGMQGPVEDHRLMELWPTVVGEKIAQVSFPEKVTNGVLYVRVPDAVWRNELSLEKDRILRLYREKTGSARLRDIRFI